MSNNPIDLTSDTNSLQGWRVPLPDLGERHFTTRLLPSGNIVSFGTGTPITLIPGTSTPEQCSFGSGWVMGLNPLTGSSVRVRNATNGAEYSFIDMNGDGRSTVADQRSFTALPSAVGATTTLGYVSGYSLDGIPTEASLARRRPNSSFSPALTTGAYGDVGAIVALTDNDSVDFLDGSGGVTVRTTSSDDSTQCTGSIGNDTVKCKRILDPSLNAKVFSTIWREIKN